jgi:hypothetical protein
MEALLKAVDDPAFRDMAGMKPLEKDEAAGAKALEE